MGFLDKAKDLISGHPDQAQQALDKAEQFADDKTGGKYSDQIASGGDKVGDALGIPGEQAAAPAEPQAEQAQGEQPQAEQAQGEQNPPA